MFLVYGSRTMDTRHRSHEGGVVVQCADDDFCAVLTCAVCLKEIPADAAAQFDAQDYVQHFCGLECLGVWRERAAAS
jgi:hypothetical protein